jgi:CheY-specific phosphatase CheX
MQASDFTPLISQCCAEVLDAMYFTTVLETSHQAGCESIRANSGYSFCLRFHGDVHGTFGLNLGASMARMLASNFLGDDEESLTSAEVEQVVGELANMLCGSIVSRVEGTSKFVLTHPEPVTLLNGANSPNQDVLVSNLETDSGDLQTWIVVDGPLGAEIPEPQAQLSQAAQ